MEEIMCLGKEKLMEKKNWTSVEIEKEKKKKKRKVKKKWGEVSVPTFYLQ
jgi:hypothetical protein